MDLQWQFEPIEDVDVISTVLQNGLAFDFFNRIGPSRQFAAAQQFGRFRSKADID